jgi:FAD-dependent urate hydroxylase
VSLLKIEDRQPATALDELTDQVRHDLARLEYPPDRKWTLDRSVDGRPVIDVLIIGGGQTGLTLAFALRQERIANVRIVDRQPAGREGPWATYARMPNLRTPKAVTGPDLGIPSLTPRTWFEARFGAAAWQRIDTVPRTAWHEYLAWYKNVLELEIENDTSVETILPEGDVLRADILTPRGRDVIYARKIVLATGLEGSGTWRIPEVVSEHLPAEKFAHSSDLIDFSRLKGQRVAVLGAAASAFDNAAAALDAGAGKVDLFVRRPQLPQVNLLYWMNFSGVLAHFGDLPDLHRWRFGLHLMRNPNPPPPASVARCTRFANFTIRLGEPWLAAADRPAGFSATTAKREDEFDFVVCATGVDPDPRRRPELKPVAEDIALWRHRFTPPAGENNELLGCYPYLGSAFEFIERKAGAAPWLRNIHNLTFGAVASMGNIGGAPSLRFAVPRLVGALVRDLFVADADAYLESFQSFQTPEPQQIHW